MKKQKAFKTCDNKGFHITFPNGVILSTQFGWGNYCENYNLKTGKEDPFTFQRENGVESNDCEIAIIAPDGKWITQEWSKNKSDNVQGRVTMDRWLKAFDFCRKWKSK